MKEREAMARAAARRASAPINSSQRILIVEDTGHSDGETSPCAAPAQHRSCSDEDVNSEHEDVARQRDGLERQGSCASAASGPNNDDHNVAHELGRSGETDELLSGRKSSPRKSPPGRPSGHLFSIPKMYSKSSPRLESSVTTSNSPPVSFITRKMKRNIVPSAVGGDDSETAAYREEEERLHSHMRPRDCSPRAEISAAERRWDDLVGKQLHASVMMAVHRCQGDGVSSHSEGEGQQASNRDMSAGDLQSSDDESLEVHSPRNGTEMQEIDADSSVNIDITVSTDWEGLTRTPRDATNADDMTVHSEFAATETICELPEDDDDLHSGGSPRTADCRICGGGNDTGPLVEACECKGSVALVHAHCLKRWIKERPDVKDATATKQTYKKLICCEICKRPYKGEYGRLAKKAAKARIARTRRQQQTQQERGRRRMDAMAMVLRALAIICGAGTVIASPFLFFQCHKMGSSGCAKLKGQPILLGIVAVICLALLVAACRKLAQECQSSRRRSQARRSEHVHPINQQAPPEAETPPALANV